MSRISLKAFLSNSVSNLSFFFQAEDGIRDLTVTEFRRVLFRSILVTGGAGYIGSVVVEQLLALGHSVVVLDDLSRGHRAAVDPRAELVRGGIADRRVLDELLARRACDALVHLAAYALVAESVAHPEMYFSNNVTGGRVLLDAVVTAGVRRVIFSSSC